MATINGITLTNPTDPVFVFNPCPMSLKDSNGNMTNITLSYTVGGTTYTFGYDMPGEGIIDIREYLQAFFTAMKMGDDIDYTLANAVSELGKNVAMTVKALAADGSTIATFSITMLCIWGAVRPNESAFTDKTVTRFSGYPFTVGVYAGGAATGVISVVDPLDANNAVTNNVSGIGLYNTRVNLTPTGDTLEVYYEFVRMGTPVKTKMYTVKHVDGNCYRDGIYLRWVNRFGQWCYWLFKKGSDSRTAASEGLFNRNDLNLYDKTYQWHGNSGRRQNLTRNDVLPVCAPLVDRDTFDFLQDVTTSPCVDMYIGNGLNVHKWAPVTIEAGTYTMERNKQYQDFIMNIVLQEIEIQQL